MESLREFIEDRVYFPMHNNLQLGILDNLGGGNQVLGDIHIRISIGIRHPIINKMKRNVINVIYDEMWRAK